MYTRNVGEKYRGLMNQMLKEENSEVYEATKANVI